MSVVTGSEAFVEVLRKEGVTDIFGIVGSAFMDPLDLFPQAGIRFISVRHEQDAALMAGGYGLASGRPGVCIGQNGPGVTNLVTGIASAYLNHVPVVLITPSVTSAGLGKTAMQEVEQMSLFSKITVYQTQVNRPDKIAWAMRNAFRAATTLQGPARLISLETIGTASSNTRISNRHNTARQRAAAALRRLRSGVRRKLSRAQKIRLS